MENKKNIYLFSRDKRTHELFRRSWENAVEKLNRRAIPILRFENKLGVLGSILSFLILTGSRRVVFGSSEILLYAFFSLKKDIWVFTGLGRLLDGNRASLQIVLFNLLRFFYRGQRIIVLNKDDKQTVEKYLNTLAYLLPGEGYKFELKKFENKTKIDGISYAYIGRLLRSKGVDVLLRKFADISRNDDKLYLYGDYDFGNRDCIDKTTINYYNSISKGNIYVQGFVDNLQKSLVGIDTVISMSRREGLPFAILDAINAGCNVILSNVAGHREFKHLVGITIVDSEEDLHHELTKNRLALRRLPKSMAFERVELADKKFGMKSVETLILRYIR